MAFPTAAQCGKALVAACAFLAVIKEGSRPGRRARASQMKLMRAASLLEDLDVAGARDLYLKVRRKHLTKQQGSSFSATVVETAEY